MVISQNVKCSICAIEYFVRVGVGGESYQKHYFDCVDCHQTIGIAVRTNPPDAHIETVENCTLGGFNRDRIVINLHPNFCFHIENYHNPLFFASLDSQGGLPALAKHMRVANDSRFVDLSLQFDIPHASQLWNKVKSIYDLSRIHGKEQLVQKQITEYNQQRNKVRELVGFEKCKCISELDVFEEFYDSLFYPKVNLLFNPVAELIDRLHDDGQLYDFYGYYVDNLQADNAKRYLSSFTGYFKQRDILGQLIYRARIDSSDVDDLMVGSKNFDVIKLYYDEVYESLTSNFTVLACLNNLASGRKFDEFLTLTLNKYIHDVEKAKKDGPFKSNPLFSAFSDNLDSSLRNGSHHASIWRDGEIVMYRSGGTGAKHEISYSRYLYLCCSITISLAALHLIELHLIRKFK